MNGYVDLFLLALPKKNLAAYKRLAKRFGKVIEDHGALEYREWIVDDMKKPLLTAVGRSVKLKPGEVLISSVVEFKSRKHRDQVNKRAMADPRMARMMKEKPLFDWKRMIYGGFATIVKM